MSTQRDGTNRGDMDGSMAVADTVLLQGEPQEVYNHYVHCLPYCVFLTVGFDCVCGELTTPKYNESCYCPCSKFNKKWRTIFGVELQEENMCGATTGFSPHGLIAHLEKTDCLYHQATLTYLRERYRDYWEDGVDHKELYPIGSEGYHLAEEAEARAQALGRQGH